MENTKPFIKIGSRGSKLALWQAHYLQGLLNKNGINSAITIIKTQGDKIQHLGFDKLEGKGFFTKELEDALSAGEIDMAVHSMKDMPTDSRAGLCLTALSYRDDPADTLLVKKEKVDMTADFRLVKGAIVGSSSARRKSQMLSLRPDVNMKDIRGNVPTRVEKLRNGDYDAILLAQAGLNRLGLELDDLEVIRLHPREFVPAPAQAVLAYQCRVDNIRIRKLLKKIHNPDVAELTNVERKVLNMMDGGCHLPLGVYCRKDEMGFYHAEAYYSNNEDGNGKKVSISLSTTNGMAQKIYNRLMAVEE
ncbi:hydroxymethylbilane synthase [Saprospiraceae bacterium]|nr:hydroxymethylbilane synthase [Saprospiraceae bacterium]